MTDDVNNNENILMNDESTLLAQTTSKIRRIRADLKFSKKIKLFNLYVLHRLTTVPNIREF